MIGNALGYLQKHVFLGNRDDFRTVPIILEYDESDHILSPVMAEDFCMMLIIIQYDGQIVFSCNNDFVPSDGRRLPYDADEQQSCPG